MGRFAQRYSVQQREAIKRAIAEDGMTATEACRRAKDGKLYDLEPFEFNVNTAMDYGGEERRRRKAQADIESGRLDGSGAVKETADLALASVRERVRALSSKRKWTSDDAELHRKLLTNLREIDAIYRRIPTVKGSNARDKATKDTVNGEQPRSDLVADLMKEMDRRGKGQGVSGAGAQAPTHAGTASKDADPAPAQASSGT